MLAFLWLMASIWRDKRVKSAALLTSAPTNSEGPQHGVGVPARGGQVRVARVSPVTMLPAPAHDARGNNEVWDPAALVGVREALEGDIVRLREEIALSEQDSAYSAIGSGEDAAGAAAFALEHEVSLAANAREMLQQTERALARIDDGTYGICEACGGPVGKLRLQAFPRATVCLGCKELIEKQHLG